MLRALSLLGQLERELYGCFPDTASSSSISNGSIGTGVTSSPTRRGSSPPKTSGTELLHCATGDQGHGQQLEESNARKSPTVSPYFRRRSADMRTRSGLAADGPSGPALALAGTVSPSSHKAEKRTRTGRTKRERQRGKEVEQRQERNGTSQRPSPPVTPAEPSRARKTLKGWNAGDAERPPTPESLPRRSMRKVSIGDEQPSSTRKAGEGGKTRTSREKKEVIVEIPCTTTLATPVRRSTRGSTKDVSAKRTRTTRKTKRMEKECIELIRAEELGERNEPREFELLARSEKGVVEHVGKIHLIQERLRHDPWKMLIATSLLNKTSGRAARPVLWVLLERWPTPQALAEASIPDLTELLYPLGLFNQRAASLVRFSRQYLDLGWPDIVQRASDCSPDKPKKAAIGESTAILPVPSVTDDHIELQPEEQGGGKLDVKIFHGSGIYASDSFRIYSPLLDGGGGPEQEGVWLRKRERALARRREARRDVSPSKGVEDEGGAGQNIGEAEAAAAAAQKGENECGVEELGEYMSDEDADDSKDEWRTVVANDKELRRYLIWRWGIEGIEYDIHKGPKIWRERDQKRLGRREQNTYNEAVADR